MARIADPLALCERLWPDVRFYDKQRETIYSVQTNIETVVPAGNMLGKDYVAAFYILFFFLTRYPCRIVTTSAKEDHLRVLWGEMGGFIDSSRYPLDVERGGPLIINQREIKKIVDGRLCKKSYIIGKVASQDKIAAMQGHHIAATGDGIPRTLFVPDECSSVPQAYYIMARTWFNRMLAIGNCWPCENFFKYAVKGEPGTKDKGGDIPSPTNGHFYRKVIQIKATDSPNVRLALAQIKAGKKPDNRIIIPGVKPYGEYLMNLERWNKPEQCVGLEAEFYEGAEVRMYPSDWLNEAAERAVELEGRARVAKSMGVDPAEGGDQTVWMIVDNLGVIDRLSERTEDTAVIGDQTITFIKQYKLEPKNVLFDRGGGGRQVADYLRRQGYPVRTIAFGEAATPDLTRGIKPLVTRRGEQETRSIYKNRRAEMYGTLRLYLDPAEGKDFAIPGEYTELRRQLSPIPLIYGPEGVLQLPPKRKKPGSDSKEVTMMDLLGCSPDEADALVLAVFGLVERRGIRQLRSLLA